MRRQVVLAGWGLLQRTLQPEVASVFNQARRGISDDANLKKTVLHDFHIQHGGKMYPYWGWSMPLHYTDGIIGSTLHCRQHACLWDVAHMCGFTLKGRDAIPFLETLVVSDVAGLKEGTGTLSVFTNEKGGTIEDTIITKVSEEELYVVDLVDISHHVQAYKAKGKKLDMIIHDDRDMLAIQGPAAAEILQAMTATDLKRMTFQSFRKLTLGGVPVWCTRTGYTGEDGFEISVPRRHTIAFVEKLLKNKRVRLAGLGARDALRLEAGLCLVGNDLNENITPIEAGLAWTVGKRRRRKFDFLGGDVIKKQLEQGVTKKRVGLISSGPPPRQHYDITTADGEVVGRVSSGGYSPCLNKNIAMGYVNVGYDKAGTQLKIVVRGKPHSAEVVKLPFVPTKYYRGEPAIITPAPTYQPVSNQPVSNFPAFGDFALLMQGQPPRQLLVS